MFAGFQLFIEQWLSNMSRNELQEANKRIEAKFKEQDIRFEAIFQHIGIPDPANQRNKRQANALKDD